MEIMMVGVVIVLIAATWLLFRLTAVLEKRR